MKNKGPLFCVIIAVGWVSISFGATITTPAGRVARSLALDLKHYAVVHSGALPKTLRELFKGNENQLVLVEQGIGGGIDERFKVLQKPIDDASEGQLVVVTSDKIYEDRRHNGGIGRYTIWHKDGTFRYSWETEERMQNLFNGAGLKLEANTVWRQPDTKYITHDRTWMWVVIGFALVVTVCLAFKRRS